MKIISLFCLIILIFLMNPLLCTSSDTSVYTKKDPIFAGALSWYMPGLGQMYGGDLVKGGVFFIVEEALLMGTVLSFAELKFDVTGDVDIGLNIKSKENPNRKEQETGILLGVMFIGVHFLNIIDAVNTSRNFNRSHPVDMYAEVSTDRSGNKYIFGFNRLF